MRQLILTILAVVITFITSTANVIESAKKGHIIGTVIDASDGRAVEYATIAIFKVEDKKLIDGGISDSEGFFRIKDNPPGKYYMTITFMGYKTLKIPNVNITKETKELALGEIRIVPNSKELADVNVVADQTSVSYKIDKKVVNVSQQLTAAAGTAVDILENIPSVKVDIDGNVSLRGSSSFTVLIDGRPTVLDPSDALSQIPSGAIDNIEIITNPSAKYEPDGTSGIINIVTKKNKLNGVSAIINTNYGRDNQYGANATVDYRNNKWHLYFGANYSERRRLGDINFNRWTLNNRNVPTDTLYQDADGSFLRGRNSGSISGGFDYSISKNDVLGVSIRMGIHERLRGSELDYEEEINNLPPKFYSTFQDTEHSGMFYSATLNYKHTFGEKKEHFIEFQSSTRYRDGDEISITELDSLGYILSGKKSTESGPSLRYQLKLDYSKPLNWGDKFESGIHANISQSEDNNEDFKLDTTTGIYEPQTTIYYKTIYTRNTYAVYGIYAGERGELGYQAGLRMEYTNRFLELANSSETYKIERPDFFPTLHLSYKLPADQELMVSYTRRIERPRGYYLEPFYTWMDANNVRKGNPDILPEYVNSFDLGYQKKFNKNFVAIEGYYRITNNKFERVKSPYEEKPSVILHTFENVGTDYALGIELTLNYSPAKWYTSNLMLDLYDYRLEGQLYDSIYSQHDFSWSTRFNNTFKLSPNTRLQVDFNYHSDRVQAQGSHDGFFMANLAFKQDFFRRKLSATFQISDVFGTMAHGSTSSTSDYYERTYFNPNTPIYMIILSYKINNYRTKHGERGNGNGGDEGDEGGF